MARPIYNSKRQDSTNMLKVGRRGLLLLLALTWFLGIKPAIGLKCYVCNSAVKGHESCKDDGKPIEKRFLVDCNSPEDYDTSFEFAYYADNTGYNKINNETKQKLTDNKFRGLYYWIFNDMKQLDEAGTTKDETEVKLNGTTRLNKPPYVCRKLVTNVPYQVAGNEPDMHRVLRMCGRLASEKKADGDNEKDLVGGKCEIRPATAKASVKVCTCNNVPKGGKFLACNSVQRPQICNFFFVLAFFAAITFRQWKN